MMNINPTSRQSLKKIFVLKSLFPNRFILLLGNISYFFKTGILNERRKKNIWQKQPQRIDTNIAKALSEIS